MDGNPCQARVKYGNISDLADWYWKECGKTDDQKPMIFRNTDWCCDNHRKVVQGEGRQA